MEDNTLLSTFEGLNLRLKSLVRRFLHDTDAAEDVIQEAFCRLWPRRDSIGSSSDAQALATTVVRNICIDRVRHEERIVECAVDEDRDSACTASAQEFTLYPSYHFFATNQYLLSILPLSILLFFCEQTECSSSLDRVLPAFS